MTGVTVSGPVETVAELLDRLNANLAFDEVLVRYGLLVNLPEQRERVYLLGTVDYERTVNSRAHRVRQERYGIRGIVEVYDIDTPGPDWASSRAWELLDTIDTVLRDDPDLGVARYDHTVRAPIDEVLPTADGWLARVAFRLGFFHNL